MKKYSIPSSVIMRTLLLIIMASFLSTSCATILKNKTYELDVSSNKTNAKVKVYDSLYSLPAKVRVKRSNQDLELSLISDSLNLDYTIKSSPNPTFLYWNLAGMQLSPLNYAIDFTNKKRFYYGKSVYLDTNDTIRIIEPPVRKSYSDYFPETYQRSKGDITLTFSIPYVNVFNFRPEGHGTKVDAGFLGISAGLDYFYRDTRYLNLNFAAAIDFLAPIPAPASYDGAWENTNTIYVSATNNHKLNRFSIGYGLNYSINNWKYTNNLDIDNEIEIKKKNKSLGITTNAYFQINSFFFAGLIYRPTFLELQPTVEFEYEHLISLDFLFKIPLRKE